MQTEYLVKQQITFTFTYILMNVVLSWLRFHQFFLMFGGSFLLRALSNRKFYKFESVRRDFVLLLINLMDENAFSPLNVISKRNITLSAFS